jgi:hypothetical protein
MRRLCALCCVFEAAWVSRFTCVAQWPVAQAREPGAAARPWGPRGEVLANIRPLGPEGGAGRAGLLGWGMGGDGDECGPRSSGLGVQGPAP